MFLAIPLTYAYAAEIDEVKAAIVKKGASWVAEENKISALPTAERNKRLGALPFKGMPPGHKTLTPAEVPENMKILPPAGTPAGTPLPSAKNPWDWRNSCYDYSATYPKLKGCCIPGRSPSAPPVCGDFVTSVKDQGNCGSCWAFSPTGALESQFLIKFLTPGKNLNLSEQILISCMGDLTQTGDTGCSGGYTTDAAQFFYDSGTGLESCYPYKAKDPSESAWKCSRACVNWHFLPYALKASGSADYGTQASPSVDQLKSMIITYGPVAVTMGVFDDFYSYKSGVYQYTYGLFEGGHAVEVVGFTDDTSVPAWDGGYFIVKNSWGSGFGMSGYFNIAYSEVSNTCGLPYHCVSFGSWGTNPAVFYYGVRRSIRYFTD